MKISTLFKLNISFHGFDYQVRKLQEECCELGAAINHFLTDRNNGDEHFHEEFMDVIILIEQLKPLLDPKKLSKYRQMKLARMEKTIREKIKKQEKRKNGIKKN